MDFSHGKRVLFFVSCERMLQLGEILDEGKKLL